jgi:hypothetical protein
MRACRPIRRGMTGARRQSRANAVAMRVKEHVGSLSSVSGRI